MKLKRVLSVFLLCLVLCLATVTTAAAAETPGYIISGSGSGDKYTLEIQVENIEAFSGRLALRFDTDKLSLVGKNDLSAFSVIKNLTAVLEADADDMVNNSKGLAALAWAYPGLNTLSEPLTIATLEFKYKSGYGAEDIDASTFQLQCLESGEFAGWKSAASFQGRGPATVPITYEYLTNANAANVTFNYAGSELIPADAVDFSISCYNALSEGLAAKVTINGVVYDAVNGVVSGQLAAGEYRYRAVVPGYGDVSGTMTLPEDNALTFNFITDADLVTKAKNELRIGYQSGDAAGRVTDTLTLPLLTESGVSISWQSSQPNIITKDGLVYLPEQEGASVTMTATLTRGAVSASKAFSVYVCSKAELLPPVEEPEDEELEDELDEEEEDIVTVQPLPEDIYSALDELMNGYTANFTDLGGYYWAEDAINTMAAAGIINGTSADGTRFSPADNIRRGDFILMLMRMIDAEASTAVAFDDVPADSYYHDAIAKARALGVTAGAGGNKFNPEAPITRQEMITLVMRALLITGYVPVYGIQTDISGYNDYNAIDSYAKDSIAEAVAIGLIQGSNGNINPKNNTTRAEAAVFMCRIYEAHHN